MLRNKVLIISVLLGFFLLLFASASAIIAPPQDNKKLSGDTLRRVLPVDSLSMKPKKKKQQIDDIINYQAEDSIVFYGNGTGYMYGKSDLKYQKMSLAEAAYIRMNMDSSLVYASAKKDSTGALVGKPIFKDESNEFTSNDLRYNFNSKRGLIHHTVTQQGEGFVVSETSKITPDKMINMINGKYTTCEDHEHPHFYLQMTKAKVKPKSFIVAGPAYLVLEDVPLPVALPFGYFPFNDKYSSGVIMPAYGDDFTRGFNLHNGGYYFALSDYVDLALTGEIYTKGTWALNGASSYVKRYKYRGNFNFSYRNDVFSEKGMPDYSSSSSMSLQWSHSQDSKSNPYSRLSGSVNFSTTSFNRNNIDNVYNISVMSQNTKTSSINFTKSFPENSWTITANANVTQVTSDTTINMTLPTLSVASGTLYPFKRKVAVGKERWYEKLVLNYTGDFSNSIQTKEYKLLKSSLSRDWRNGAKHNISTNASFSLFNYITITPSFNYTERWYMRKINQRWDEAHNAVAKDTTTGFFRSYNFSGSLSAQTTLYGFYVPSPKIFGDKIDRIRHVFVPSFSFSYNPDFSDPIWGSYTTYSKYVAATTSHAAYQETVKYSPFESEIYGYAGAGKSGAIGYSFTNNIEMKVKQKSDTTDLPVYKVISLIDNLSISGSYNLVADSLRWSLINANLRIKMPFSNNFTLNVGGTFDPYMYGLNSSGQPVHVDRLRWNHGKLPRFMGTSFSQSFTLNNDTFKKKTAKEKAKDKEKEDKLKPLTGADLLNPELVMKHKQDSIAEQKKNEKRDVDADGYVKPTFKWSVSANYGVQYGQSSFNYKKLDYNMGLTHSLSFNGTLSPTPKWSANWSATYSFSDKKLTQVNLGITRDLHCWSMSAQIVPVGYYTSYSFKIAVKSSLLQDLKYEKRSNSGENVKWE
jgi:hypothetical protein